MGIKRMLGLRRNDVYKMLDSLALPYFHVAPPERCEKLKAIVARCGGSVEHEPFDAHVDYPLPALCPEDVARFFSRHAAVEFEEEFIGHLPGGRVFASGVVVSPDGRSVARDVSVDFGQPFERHWLLDRKAVRRPTRVPDSTLLSATASGNTYYHWLLDELPRLIVGVDQGFENLIANVSTPWSHEAIALAGYRGQVLVPSKRSHFQCDHLIVPSLIGRTGNPTPKSVELLSRFAEPLYRDRSPFGERIYLSREKAVRRRVLNEDALWSFLEPRGFRKLILEEVPWKDQVNAFWHARVIVAPHGAGLANLVFCRPGTTVVEFFHRGYMHWVFWQIAALKGLDYRPVVPASDEPLTHDFGHNPSDLIVDMEQLMAAWNAAAVQGAPETAADLDSIRDALAG